MIISDLALTLSNGNRLDLPTHRASGVVVTNTRHGYGSISFDLPLSPAQLVVLYGNPRVLDVSLKHAGAIFNGRLEDIQIQSDHVTFAALGYWRALSDIEYSALWSVTSLDKYTQHWLISAVAGPTLNRQWSIDKTDSAINIGLVKNSIFAGNPRGEMHYEIPHLSSRNITGLQCDIAFLASANVTLRISAYNTLATFPYYSFSANITSVLGNGVLQHYSLFVSFTGTPIIAFGLEATTAHNYVGETGAEYVTFSNIRLVSDVSNAVFTTTTATRTNGTAVTITVVTTVGMYVGQRVFIASGVNQESTIVLSVPTSTTFTADINRAPGGAGYPIGTQVDAWLLYPNQIVSSLVATVNAVNPTQLSSSIGLIQTAAYDLLDETYEDQRPSNIIEYLCSVGDGINQFEAGIFENKQLYYRIRNSAARTWYIDYEDPDIRTSLDALYNSYYAKYEDYNKRNLRTVTNSDTTSISKYGVTRQNVIDVKGTNTTLVATQRDLALASNKTILPQANVVVSKVWVNAGLRGRLEDVRPSDYIIAMNLPPVVLGTGLDLLRTFRVVETSLDLDNAELTLVPELLLPSLVRQVAGLLTS